MKMADIREMSDAELKRALSDLTKEKFNLKIQSRTGQLQNSARVRQIKLDIARIKTEMVSRLKK